MGRIIRNLNAYIKGFLYKMVHPSVIEGKIRAFHGSSIRLYKGSSAVIESGVKIDDNALIAVQNGGHLVVGGNVGIGPNNFIVCHKHIEIGSGTIMGPNVLIYDHDHQFSKENGVDAHHYTYASVEIGKNCWIGADTVILKGTHLGDNCIVGAGSIIKGNYPNSSLIIQKRETEIRDIK